ncbi:MAG: argininosuccinate lyase [Anaerolineae bacterium]
MKLWGGRFEKPTDELMEQFNASIGFDRRLYDADITGSVVYARALARAGLISDTERDTLIDGLEQVRAEFAAGTFQVKPGDEDIHTAVERRLHELVGDPSTGSGHRVAGKLHTGRSRNDQVATDVRLFLLDAIDHIDELLGAVQHSIISQAEAHLDAVMPGYTHLRQAQPVFFSHWLMSYFWMLQRDRERLAGCAERTAVLPLGAGALAGNALGVDREFLARALGFRDITPNSIDAVSDRDFIAEFLFAAALIGVHLSRLAEDLILYSTYEFGFVQIDEAYATGSSLMPQKMNPDALELSRGKSGRLIGHLVGLLTTLKGLPSTYNKDLQEDKEPLFDSIDTLVITLPVVAGVVETLHVDEGRMAAALDDAMLATDLADYLVRRGVPFREAHGVVGRLVRKAGERNTALRELPLEEFQAEHTAFEADVYETFDFVRSVQTKSVVGGTAPAAVEAQIAQARALLTTASEAQRRVRET